MSTPAVTLDLTLDDDAFLGVYADLLQVKVDESSGIEDEDARRKAIAAWGNLMDDFVIACKRALRRLYRGTGSPEGVVTAPPSSLYQRTDGTGDTVLYVKRTGTGNTGWDALGSGGDADTLQGATLAEVMLTGIEELDGNPSSYVDLVQIDQTSGLALTLAGAGTIGRVAAVRTGTPANVGTVAAAGSAASLAPMDHVHALSAQVLRDAGVVYDSNWGALGNNAFTDGTESIDGVNWTVAVSSAAANAWGVGNTNGFGQGVEWGPTNGGSTKIFNSTTQTAAHFYTTFGTLLGANFDPAARYQIEVQYTITVAAAEATRLYIGLWNLAGVPTGSVVRQRLACLITQGANSSYGVQRDAATADTITTNLTTGNDVLGIVVEPEGSTTCFGGLYSGGWPRSDGYHHVSTEIANGPGMNRADTPIVISSSVNAATPALSRWTIHRMRVRRV